MRVAREESCGRCATGVIIFSRVTAKIRTRRRRGEANGGGGAVQTLLRFFRLKYIARSRAVPFVPLVEIITTRNRRTANRADRRPSVDLFEAGRTKFDSADSVLPASKRSPVVHVNARATAYWHRHVSGIRVKENIFPAGESDCSVFVRRVVVSIFV